MIIKFDEAALNKAFGPTFVEGMRHIVRQLGALTEQTTLPEVAAATDALTPRVDQLTLTLTATNAAVDELEAASSEQRYSDNHLVRRLDYAQAEFEQAPPNYAPLLRKIEEAELNASAMTQNIAELTRRIRQLEDAQL